MMLSQIISCLHRVLHVVDSSYILLICTTLYSLCSVPLALHYLHTIRFGIRVVMGTLAVLPAHAKVYCYNPSKP
jgi:hypothetical protein